MAFRVELSCLENFPSYVNPLDVLTSQSHLETIFHNRDGPRTAFFTPWKPSGPGRNGILMYVHATTDDEIANCTGKHLESSPAIRLFASRLFLRHHSLQQLGGTGAVRAVTPVRLHRVVLGVRSRNGLRLAGAEQVRKRLLESCWPEQGPLARQGEPLLLLPPNLQPREELTQELLVLECSPVTQGRITMETSVVLTECSELSNPAGVPPPCRLLRLCVSDFAQYTDSFSRGKSLLDDRRLLGSGSCDVLQAMECRVDMRVVDMQHWLDVIGHHGEAVDIDNCVFISKQLLLKLGLVNKVWVKLWRPNETCQVSTGESNSRWTVCAGRPVCIQVVDLTLTQEQEIQNSVGFLSATLWFNLTGGDVVPVNGCILKMKRWEEMPGKPSSDHSDSLLRLSSPSLASELQIQPVLSQLSNNLNCCDNLLADHFRIPRLVLKGDLLAVPAKNHPDLLGKNSEGIQRCPMVFFRVQKVCPSAGREGEGAHLANRTHTSLYMGACINSPIPCCSLGGPLSSVGFNKTVELTNIILPHLKYSSLCSCTILLHGPAGSGKTNLVKAASCSLNLHLLKVDCVSVYADTPAATEVKLRTVFQHASTLKPCILLLRNLQLLVRHRGVTEEDGRVQATLCQLLNSTPSSVVVVATVCGSRLSAGVVAAFVHQVALDSPTEDQRHDMLVSLSSDMLLGRDVSLERLSKLTAGFVLSDLSALLVEAGRAACRRLIHTSGVQTQEDLCYSGVTLQNQDLISALETLQHTQSKAVGTPKIPNVRWEDVGGLHHVKKEILNTIQLPLQHPELLALGLNRTGVLLYGPPGTGKTLLAKAVATECSMTFLSVKGPELINMYVGQSEDNIREVFRRARSAAPCVVFFDELDSLAPSRGSSGDSGGVMDRVVSQLLAELDALHSPTGVFVIGATNRPDLLDQSLLRPGRFDKLLYVGIKKERDSQLKVLQAILRKFQLDSSVNLQDLLRNCPAEMTGADLYALCSDAMTAAIKRKITLINEGLDSEGSPVLLSWEDFSTAVKNFKPSVSRQELLRYDNIQQKLAAM